MCHYQNQFKLKQLFEADNPKILICLVFAHQACESLILSIPEWTLAWKGKKKNNWRAEGKKNAYLSQHVNWRRKPEEIHFTKLKIPKLCSPSDHTSFTNCYDWLDTDLRPVQFDL